MVSLLLLSTTLVLANPNALLESAQSSIAEDNWQEAATILDEYVRTASHPSAEAMYDRGVAYYNLGNYEEARVGFDNAMFTTEDTTLKTYSAFNLGNAIYQQTLQSLEGKGTQAPTDEDLIAIEDAKSQIEEVLQNYRTSISSDPTDMDARANGELAWQMLQQLDQMQQQMEEQQQQQNDQQEQQQEDQSADEQQEHQQEQEQGGDSDQENQDQQQEGEQSEENQDQQQDGDQPEEKQDQQQDQGNQSQDNQNQQSEDSAEEHQQQNNQQEQQQDGDQTEKDQQQQQDGEQTEEQQQPQQGELETTEEEMNKSKRQLATEPDEGDRLSEEEANRLLQLIRDKEQQRRKELAARRASRRVPVEKDW